MEISKVGVVGCGLMGHGIAQICAQAGWDVVVREVSQEKLDGGIGKIDKQLARAVEKGKAEQSDADAVRGRIQPTLDYSDLADCDLVIEAITEDLGLKLEMWKQVDGVVKDGATFATNTSSLSVAEQAAATSRPERFLGLHFFNPAQVMPLLEVVRAEGTGDEAVKLGFELGEKLGKTTVAAQDNRGFIVNRLLVPYMLDAIRACEQGVGSIEDIDTGDEGGRHPPDGAADPRRLRRAGHAGVDRRRDARGLRRGALRAAADAAPSWSRPATTGASPAGASTTTRVSDPLPPTWARLRELVSTRRGTTICSGRSRPPCPAARSAITGRPPSRASCRCASAWRASSTRSRSPRRRCSPTGSRRASAPTAWSPAWRWSAAAGWR